MQKKDLEKTENFRKDDKMAYSVWGIRVPYAEKADGIYSVYNHNTWEFIKDGGPTRRSLSGLSHKLYSQLEVRDSNGKTIISVMLDNKTV